MTEERAILLSGGVDSAYLLVLARRARVRSVAVFVDYGQPARKMEALAAAQLADAFGWRLSVVSLSGMPLGQMGEGIGAHVVPMRNLWLLSIASAFAPEVWIGCAPQDEREYEDCRLHFLASADDTLRRLGHRLHWSNAPRADRIDALEQYDLLRFTWSCYGPGPEPCGVCASCAQ